MHKISDVVRKLGWIVYGDENKVPESQMLNITVTGVRDDNNDVHLILVNEDESECCKYTVRKIYESFTNDPSWLASVLSFESTNDIDFMTLISYVKLTSCKSSGTGNTDEQILSSLNIAKVLLTNKL